MDGDDTLFAEPPEAPDVVPILIMNSPPSPVSPPQSSSSSLPAPPSSPPVVLSNGSDDDDEQPVVKRRLRKNRSAESSMIAEVKVGRAEKTKRGEDFTALREQLTEQFAEHKACITTGYSSEQMAAYTECWATMERQLHDLTQAEAALAEMDAKEQADTGVVSSDEDEEVLDMPTEADIVWQKERIVDDDDAEVQRDNRRAYKRLTKLSRREDDATDAHALRDPSDRRAVLSRAVLDNASGHLAKGAEQLEQRLSAKPKSLGRDTGHSVLLDTYDEPLRTQVRQVIEIALKFTMFELDEVDPGGNSDTEATLAKRKGQKLEQRIGVEHEQLASRIDTARLDFERLCAIHARAMEYNVQNSADGSSGQAPLTPKLLAVLDRAYLYVRFVNDVLKDRYADLQTDVYRQGQDSLAEIGLNWSLAMTVPHTTKPERLKQYVNVLDGTRLDEPGKSVFRMAARNNQALFVETELQFGRFKRMSRAWLGRDLLSAMIKKVFGVDDAGAAEAIPRSVRRSFDRSLNVLLRTTLLVNAVHEMLAGADEVHSVLAWVEGECKLYPELLA